MNEDKNGLNISFEDIILGIIGLALLRELWIRVPGWVATFDGGSISSGFFTAFYWLQIVAIIISFILLWFIVYSVVGITRIRKEENEEAEKMYQEHSSGDVDAPINPEWVRIRERVESDSPAEWRLAILDADVLLERMVERMQYPGDTLSERLKNVERSDFNSIDAAWEAHKVRNKIAHEGADFVLTEREARRIIGLYEQVFREFHYI